MDITGRIISVLPLKSGVKNEKEWKIQEYVLEVEDLRYPTHLCFSVFGDKIDTFSIKQGENVTVSFNIDAREYNGRWFNSITAWKVFRNTGGNTQYSAPQQPAQASVQQVNTAHVESDELPF